MSHVLGGLKIARRRLGVVTWLYVVSLFAALPFGLAAAWLTEQTFASSLVGDELLRHLSTDLLLEWLRQERRAVGLMVPFGAGVVLSMLGWSAFFDGAVVSAVASEGPVRTGDFYSGGGRVFGRMLRLLCFGLPFTLLVTGGTGLALLRGLRSLTADWIDERAVFGAQLGSLLLLALILSWCKGAHDLMKVEAVAKGEHRARWAFWRGLSRALVAPHSVLAANLPFLGLGVLLTIVGLSLDLQIQRIEPTGIALAFALEQGAAFLRSFLEVAMTGAMVGLARGRGRG